MITILDDIASESASAATTRIMTTMPTTIHITTTAVAMSFSGACTPRMAGAINPFRSAIDGLSAGDVIASGKPAD
jgi:hypothetical protein